MLDRATFESQIRTMTDRELSEFGVRQVFEQSASLAEIKTSLINHEGRLTKLEGHHSGNPSLRAKRSNHEKLIFVITAGIACLVAGVVTALKWLGVIK